MAIDLSTHAIAEAVYTALSKSQIPMDQILTVWHGVGDPIFNINQDFSAVYNVHQQLTTAIDNIRTNKLNFAQISKCCGVDKDIAEKIYTKFLQLIVKGIESGRSILLTFHRVAEMTIRNKELKCKFMPDFISSVTTERKRSGAVPGSRVGSKPPVEAHSASIKGRPKSKEDQEAEFLITRGGMTKFPPKPVITKQPRPRARNPITGENFGDQDDDVMKTVPQQIKDRDRNPYLNNNGNSNTDEPHYNPVTGGVVMKYDKFDSANRPMSAGSNRPRSAATPDARRMAAIALDVGNIIPLVRERIVSRGGTHGIRSLGRLMKIMDDNGDKRLSKDELRYGLRDYGIDVSPLQLEQLMLYFDRDRSGFVDFNEFLVGMRGPMNSHRKSVIREAFHKLDADKTGVVTMDELLCLYDTSRHPDVLSGKLTSKQAMKDFAAQWDKDGNGTITLDEFEDYYKDVSASIDDDAYFDAMIRNCWRIRSSDSGGTGSSDDASNRRGIVTRMETDPVVTNVDDDRKEGRRPLVRRQQQQDEGSSSSSSAVRRPSTSGGGSRKTHQEVRRVWGQGPGLTAPINTNIRTERDSSSASSHRPRPPSVSNTTSTRNNPVVDNNRDFVKNGSSAQRNDNGNDEEEEELNFEEDWDRNMSVSVQGDQYMAPDAQGQDEQDEDHRHHHQHQHQYPQSNNNGRPSSAPQQRQRRSKSEVSLRVAPPLPSSPSPSPSPAVVVFDPQETLRTLIYDPPLPLDRLATKLQISMVGVEPKLVKEAFLQRISVLNPSLSHRELLAVWNVIDTKKKGFVDVTQFHSFLVTRFGRDKSAKAITIVEKVIARILEKAGNDGGLGTLQRIFKSMDQSGDGKLSKTEFRNGLQRYGIQLNQRELDDSVLYFDADKSGCVDVEEFHRGIRGDMNEFRRNLIRQTFHKLDADRSGVVTMDELLGLYDTSRHPDVLSGKLTSKQALKDFAAQWDKDSNGDDTITLDEFEEYYRGVSSIVDGDRNFELMIRNSWRTSGGDNNGVVNGAPDRRVLASHKDSGPALMSVDDDMGANNNVRKETRRRQVRQQEDSVDDMEMYDSCRKKDGTEGSRRKGTTGTGGSSSSGRRPSTPGGGSRKQEVRRVWGQAAPVSKL
eukprot:gene5047-10112_t